MADDVADADFAITFVLKQGAEDCVQVCQRWLVPAEPLPRGATITAEELAVINEAIWHS